MGISNGFLLFRIDPLKMLQKSVEVYNFFSFCFDLLPKIHPNNFLIEMQKQQITKTKLHASPHIQSKTSLKAYFK